MYMIGMAGGLLSGSPDPTKIMLAANLGLTALAILGLSTVTTTFLDVYSAGISLINIFPKVNDRMAAVGFTVIGMHHSAWGPIGSERLPAPQGTLMATIIQGVLSRDLPWGYIFVGAALSLTVQLCGVNGLAWAVGAYLPIATTFPIFVGGAMRWIADAFRGQADESELSSGMLYSTGLVAGGSIAGLMILVILQFAPGITGLGERLQGKLGDVPGTLIALGAFALLCAVLVRKALQKLEL